MFTGIVTEVGVISEARKQGGGFGIRIEAPRTARGLPRGGSVAVDGVCLTAVSVWRTGFALQVVPETVRRSTLKAPRKGQRVNLERPVRASDEIGGHFVQGHVDAEARVARLRRLGKDVVLTLKLPDSLRLLAVEKGSIAINGVSLTVASVKGTLVSVALIPHTLAETNLGDLGPGDTVNVETDILGKYVMRILESRKAR